MSHTDEPTPPGGPQRQDVPSTGIDPSDEGVDREAEDSVEDRHGGTLSVEEEQPRPEPDEDDLQEENAETSLDQPSEG